MTRGSLLCLQQTEQAEKLVMMMPEVQQMACCARTPLRTRTEDMSKSREVAKRRVLGVRHDAWGMWRGGGWSEPSCTGRAPAWSEHHRHFTMRNSASRSGRGPCAKCRSAARRRPWPPRRGLCARARPVVTRPRGRAARASRRVCGALRPCQNRHKPQSSRVIMCRDAAPRGSMRPGVDELSMSS